MGKAAIQTGSAYVVAETPLLQAKCDIMEFKDFLHNWNKTLTSPNKHLTEAYEDVKGLHMQAENIIDSLSLREPFLCSDTHDKRFLGLGLGLSLLKFGGTALNFAQMQALRGKVHGLSSDVNLIATRVNTNKASIDKLRTSFHLHRLNTDHRFDAIDNLLTLQSKMDKARAMISNMRIIANQLHANKLDASLIAAKDFKAQVQKIKDKANKIRRKVPPMSVPELYEMPLSFAIDKRGTLITFAEIPLLSETVQMNLFKLTPIPFHAEGHDYVFDLPDPYLAVGVQPATTFTTLSDTAFARCNNLQGLFVCPQIPVLLKHSARLKGKDKQRCTYSLFRMDPTTVAEFCTLSSPKNVEIVHEMGHNTFVLYSSSTVTLNINCPDAPMEYHTILHTATIYLPAGCEAFTFSNWFHAPAIVESDVATKDVKVHALKFLDAIEHMTGFNPISHMLQTEEDDREDAKSVTRPGGIIALAALVGVAAIIGLVTFLAIRYRKHMRAFLMMLKGNFEALQGSFPLLRTALTSRNRTLTNNMEGNS